MPHSLFLRLGISKLKPIKMSIQLADRSIKYPLGVCENLLVKIDKFIFLVDFVVLEMDGDETVPIILGRPFLTTSYDVIDVHEGKWTDEGDEISSEKVQTVSFYPKREPIEPLEWKTPENRLNPSIKELPQLELKELPDHLEYAFLQEGDQLLVVITSYLYELEKSKLIEVLKNHKGAIA
ncbi:DNA-directed DNA polymerase [Tanacetum coccineum]